MNEHPTGNCFSVAASLCHALGHGLDDTNLLVSEPEDREHVRRGLEMVRQLQDDTSNVLAINFASVRLVHGVVRRPTDDRLHVHAWVEIDVVPTWASSPVIDEGDDTPITFCVDASNDNEVCIPRGSYYDMGVECPIKWYERHDALRMLVEHEHWGPWEPDEFWTQQENAA